MKRIVYLTAGFVTCMGLLSFFLSQPAEALANPLRGLRTFQITCATTATRVTDNLGDMSAFTVFNGTATAAFLGGSDVNATTKGMPICTTASTCYADKFPVDGGGMYCMSVGGAVVLTVMAGR